MRLQSNGSGKTPDQGFLDRNVVIRFFMGALAVFTLGSYMHFREPSREILELNKKADKFVVAQANFSFFDEELTNQLKQEAARDIGAIYRLDEKYLRERVNTFGRNLSEHPEWRQEVTHTTFDEISKITQQWMLGLSSIRFADSKTLTEVKALNIKSPRILGFIPSSLKKGDKIPPELLSTMTALSLSGEFSKPEVSKLITKFFKSEVWKFKEDRKLRDQLRHMAQDQVEPVYTKVYAGERLIDQGEVVTSKHIIMLQAMKHAMQQSRNMWHPMTLLGSYALAAVLVLSGFIYLRSYHQNILYSNKNLLLMYVICSLTLLISKLLEYFLISMGGLFEMVHYPLYLPFCAILLGSLLNARVALFACGVVTLILSITLSVDTNSFILVNVLASIFAIFGSKALFKRKDIFGICLKSWIGVLCTILALTLYHNIPWSLSILTDMVTTLCFMLLTAILVAGLLPIFETVFNVLTNITLMEYMDPSNSLLRRLMMEAPGTYQHSMLVGNLAESGASSINANGLFCRVSTLYHDIGKLSNPYYFTENQQGGVNMHQLLTPLESAQVIIGHVRDGVALARKEGLPEQFIDIIKEHHGITLAQCMYHDQCKLMGGDKSLVDERDFRYMGPKPRSKESAIIMISDVLEAASRTLEEFTDDNLTALVEALVKNKADDGQFDDCSLTFEELGIVKRALVKTLLMAGHSRVKYPYQLQAEEEAAKDREG